MQWILNHDQRGRMLSADPRVSSRMTWPIEYNDSKHLRDVQLLAVSGRESPVSAARYSELKQEPAAWPVTPCK